VQDEDKEMYRDMFRTITSIVWDPYKGDFGETVRKKLDGQIPKLDWNDCFVYDTMALAVTAADFMRRRGLNFYDWKETIKAVRSVRLLGWSLRCQKTTTTAETSTYRTSKPKTLELGSWRK
jgi:hypothetical protein